MTPEEKILAAVAEQIPPGSPVDLLLKGLPAKAVLAGGWPLAVWQGRHARDFDIFVNPGDYEKAKKLFLRATQPEYETDLTGLPTRSAYLG